MRYDILFLGRLFPRQLESEIKTKMKTGMQDAANALQWNIIDGLDANDPGTVTILDYLPVDSYPRGYTDRRIEEYRFCHTFCATKLCRPNSSSHKTRIYACSESSILIHRLPTVPSRRFQRISRRGRIRLSQILCSRLSS